jgi:GT2 family glycosyltransferase
MKMEFPVSIVIPVYNRLKKTTNLLDSLAAASFSCEIIIVDDNSTDDLESLINRFTGSLNIKYIRNKANMGPSFSRNIGIKNSSYNFVAFTDNDCVVSNDWMQRMYEYIRDASSNIAGIGGRTLAYGDDLISQYYEYNKILDPWFDNGRCLYIVSANAIFKKDILEKVGGFDENIKKAGGEDVGLCFKIINVGYELLYNPDAIIYHDFDNSIINLWKTFYRYGQGCRAQYERYYKSTDYKNIGYAGNYFDYDNMK